MHNSGSGWTLDPGRPRGPSPSSALARTRLAACRPQPGCRVTAGPAGSAYRLGFDLLCRCGQSRGEPGEICSRCKHGRVSVPCQLAHDALDYSADLCAAGQDPGPRLPGSRHTSHAGTAPRAMDPGCPPQPMALCSCPHGPRPPRPSQPISSRCPHGPAGARGDG